MIIADTVREAKKFIENPSSCPRSEPGEISINQRTVLEMYINAHNENENKYPYTLNALLEYEMVRDGPLNHSIITEDDDFFSIIVYSLHPVTLEIDHIIELTGEDEPEQYHEIFPEFANRAIAL